MEKELSFVLLFEQFIKDTQRGKRLKPNGERVKPQTIENYRYVLGLVIDFTEHTKVSLRIKSARKLKKEQLAAEHRYWKKFYLQFSQFLAKQKGCHDNYIGMVFKNIRAFFNYLKKEKLLAVGEFQQHFYVRKEEIPVITLMPEQLQFLINDKSFEDILPINLKQTKDLFVIGCTVALRCSDLFQLRFRDLEQISGNVYLVSTSIKTEQTTRVKLPVYAVEIINRYRKGKKENERIFKSMSKNQLNKNIKRLAETAGWTHCIGKTRKQNGKTIELYNRDKGKTYRFCDLVSSHVMRRTAITTMLMLGMPEHVVRKISGHAANSKAFYRYVNFVQSYLDTEIDKVHEKLMVA